MNKTKYLQTDGRWGGLVYPKKPCYIRNVGCGEVAIANLLIEMEHYAKYTPATIQPFCKKYGAPNCDGTYFSGIPAMMKHYGLTDVKECATMSALWKELEKGERVAVYLMGSRAGGSKGVHWTSGGHFVCSVGYKYENGLHKLYVKDSYSNSSLRNGWISYEANMRNDVVRVWVGRLSGTPTADTSGKLIVDGIGGEDTVKATQKFFGTNQNGIVSGQLEKMDKYYPALVSVDYDKKGGGSIVIKALQKWLGLTQDGVIGQGTTAAWQKRLRDYGYLAKDEKIDGYFGVKSMSAWQRFLNDHETIDKVKPLPTEDENEKKEDEKKPYGGTMPSRTLKKTNAEAKADTVEFAKHVCSHNLFHYGHGQHAHHNGCYYCETQPTVKKTSGIKDWKTTYCCNPFVNACLAHGGCIPEALSLCRKGKSLAFDKGKGYDASKAFTKLGKPKKSKLQPADVLCSGHHVALYIGNDKIAEAAVEDNNVEYSASWNKSIRITTLTKSRYKGFDRVYRYNGSVNTAMNIRHGEVGKRVKALQNYLIWYGCNIEATGIFNDATFRAVKRFQKENGLKVTGIVNAATIAAMKKVVK